VETAGGAEGQLKATRSKRADVYWDSGGLAFSDRRVPLICEPEVSPVVIPQVLVLR
jgi:hypothetical protein